MPIYVYKCRKCDDVIEVRHGFDEKPPKTCRRNGCRGKLERVFTPPAIVFKGKGFYVNDYGRGNGKRRKDGDDRDRPEKVAEKAKEKTEKAAQKLD